MENIHLNPLVGTEQYLVTSVSPNQMCHQRALLLEQKGHTMFSESGDFGHN